MIKQLTMAAQTAKAVKVELKARFPNTKFSVKSENFSMGDSVRINWTDGPTNNSVRDITDKYQYGHFNGMEDIYEYSNKNEGIPQAQYVQTQRTMSPEMETKIIEAHNQTFCEKGQIKDKNAWNENAQCWNSNLIYRKFEEEIKMIKYNKLIGNATIEAISLNIAFKLNKGDYN